jgi:methionyl-tRNA synthetase
LPDVLVASEYVTIKGDKLSKSKGSLVTAEELVNKVDSDMIRYYFQKHVNDRKDVNFSYDEFVATINSDLVNGFGNLVNRTLSFVKTKFDGRIGGKVTASIQKATEKTFNDAGGLIHGGKINKALHRIFEIVAFANKHFDTCEPWKSVKTDVAKCTQDIYDIVAIIANLARLLFPFIPKACEKLSTWLGIPHDEWKAFSQKEFSVGEIEVLFKRLDVKDLGATCTLHS